MGDVANEVARVIFEHMASVEPEHAAARGVAVLIARPDLLVRLAVEAGALRTVGSQWTCSTRCWQEGGPHDKGCQSRRLYEVTQSADQPKEA